MPADPPARPTAAPAVSLDVTLEMVDPRIAGLIAAETDRQRQKLVFIASESLCPKAVREAVGSPFSNLYAEGYPSTRMAVHERDLLDWEQWWVDSSNIRASRAAAGARKKASRATNQPTTRLDAHAVGLGANCSSCVTETASH